jgi:hypothetical protein
MFISKMTRSKKLLSGVLVVFLVIAAGLFLTARFLPESDFVKQTIESKVAEVTGRQVSLGKVEIRIGFPSLINAVVDNISVSDNDGNRLFSVREIMLNIGFWSIVTGNPTIDNLRISEATFVMYRNPSGHIESLLSKKPEAVSESSAKPGLQQSELTKETLPEKSRPLETKTGTAPEKRQFSWPIKYVLIESSRLILEDTSVTSPEPTRFSLEKINGQINRDGSSIKFNMVGTPTIPGVQSSELITNGSLLLSDDFTILETAQISCIIESANLSDLSFLPRPVASWFNRLEIRKLDLSSRIERGKLPRIDFSSGLFPTGHTTSALKITGSGELTPDFGQLEKIEFQGASEDIPLEQMGGTVPDKFLDQIGHGGSVSTDFAGTWTRPGDWSVDGSAKLKNVQPPPKFRFLGSRLTTSISFRITSDSFSITDFDLRNENSEKILNLKGLINNPFSDARSLKLDLAVGLKGEWIGGLGIKLPKDMLIQGPMLSRIHVEGPLNKLELALVGDMTGTKFYLKSFLEKQTGVKAILRAQTVLSLDVSGSSSILQDPVHLGIKIQEATVKLGQEVQSFNACPLFLTADISSSKGELNVKKFHLKISLPDRNVALLSARGHVNRLNSGSPDLGIKGDLALNREIIGLLGTTVKIPIDLKGLTNLSFNIQGSPNSFKWSLNAPLKDLSISIGEWFLKKGGVDMAITSVGSYSPEEVHVSQARVKGPGLVVTGVGKISVKSPSATYIKLDIAEAELGALASLFPQLGSSGLSGTVKGALTLGGSPQNEPQIKGTIHLLSLNYKPHNSPLTFEKINGAVQVSGTCIESKQLKGLVKGTVDAPVKASIELCGLENLEKLRGQASVSAGPGKLSAGRLRSVLTGAQKFIEPLLNQDSKIKSFDPFELQSLTTDLQIGDGVVKTENLKLISPELAMGAIAKANLRSQQIDVLSYIKASVTPLSSIGSIPMVKDIIKKNEGFLKATGLDRELRKWGIDASKEKANDASEQPKKENTVNLIVKIAGLWAEPTVMPVLESVLPRGQVNHLKSLVN